MQERSCIKEWLVTEPCIRGSGSISDQKSSNGSICRRDGVDHFSPLASRSNVKKIGLNICSDRTQDRTKRAFAFLNVV